ncbi:MAG: peptidyl-tRNA hydrolase [Desulfobacteraceae bacterium]|nr:MAG: peptidyl-tRNA hydrolase [Desulfobacteraceae bacterium]
MNRSGPPLRQLADFFRIQSQEMVIVHDDIDLAFQRLKIKEKGGDGGHKGIRSIINAFGGGDFIRVRLGVGRSRNDAGVVNHVLKAFDRDEMAAWDEILRRACEAVVTILDKGPKDAMNCYNRKLS